MPPPATRAADSVLKIIGFALVVGPALGALVFAEATMAQTAVEVSAGQPLDRIGNLLWGVLMGVPVALIGLPWAYAFGALPALVGGALFAFLDRHAAPARSRAWLGAICGLLAALGGAAQAVRHLAAPDARMVAATMLVSGALAGWVCGRVAHRRGWSL